jgi:hypothetical protein
MVRGTWPTIRMAITAAVLSSCQALAEGWTDERMIVASESVVITFEGSSVKLAGQQRTARVNLYLAKADDFGAVRYGVDVEDDCARRLQREVHSTGWRSDGTSPTIKRDPGDDAFKPVDKVLAWPLSSPIPAALTPQRVWADKRRTWESYQAPTRAAISALARRHGLELRWPDDIPLEVVATFPAQAGLSVEFSIGLEKGSIECWGPGWDLGSVVLHRPEAGLPTALDQALDALIDGGGRLLVRTALGASSPFCVCLQVRHDGRWKTVLRRCSIPVPPVWATIDHHERGGTGTKRDVKACEAATLH